MDFDISKENIQPLRGGRNASQLEVALQAQNNHEFQRELLQQKEEFENAIQNYEGDDPLETWYNYISWIEQSYPKHGYEGNLMTLLEECIKKFEDNKQYLNDRRLCKIWIKFIDYQQNPLELYHMLYAKGICRGVADMYKAWAYYFEVVGDYKSADLVFQRGERELAQPFEELMMAHRNMIYAAGQEVIKGVDQNRLEEQRLALTCLRTYKQGKVSNIRIPSSSGPGTLGVRPSSEYNVTVPVHEDAAESIAGAEAAPFSIISIAKRKDGHKENVLKPGPWTTGPNINKNLGVQRCPPFIVHEDSNDITQRGLILPPDFFPVTHDDFSTFKPSLIFPEPADPRMIPKYPKSLVYAEENIEYSIEEIKARQYLIRPNNCLNVSHCETQQAIQSILDEKATGAVHRSSYKFPQTVMPGHLHMSPQFPVGYSQTTDPILNYDQHNNSPYNQEDLKNQVVPSQFSIPKENNSWSFQQHENHHDLQQTLQPPLIKSPACQPFASPNRDSYVPPITMEALWRSPKEYPNESLYSDSSVMQVQLKACAMKTPFKILSDDDLAETGSRGGLDIAAAAQPADGAIINLDEDTNSSYGDALQFHADVNLDSTSTQAFNFNLNAMKVSTPVQERHNINVSQTEADSTKKKLFMEQKALSTILEETKSYGFTSSSGSSLGTHSRKINHINVTSEQNSYSSNLAQNLKANEALRSSLLGEYMDCQSQQSSPVTEIPPPIPSVKPTIITPLIKAPSDPFQGSIIKTLLERINFPGQHTYGYTKISSVPRLNIKREVVTIGYNKYYVEKILGKGTYGSVFKGVDCNTSETVALKLQKPANKWEFYICRELQARLANHPLKEKFMDVSIGYFNNEYASILVSDYSPNGSLLDVTNAIKQKSGRTMKEILCVYFCIEMLEIVEAMHQSKIIHADVKPDNFLVQLMDNSVTLQLIDFGCSIDMAMFPPGSTFNRRVRTEDFVCCEMHDGRPWSYHTDLFCVAATAHVLLFDKYIQMQKKDGHWSITQRFTRYWRVDCWNQFFSNLLNQQTGPASIEPLVTMLKSVLAMNMDDYHTEMRFLVNLLKGQ